MYMLPKALVFESVLRVHSDSVPWSPQHWLFPPPLFISHSHDKDHTWALCHHMNLLLLRYLNFQNPTPTTTFCSPSFLSCQFPVPLSSRLTKARRIQLWFLLYFLLEKTSQPGRLEPLSITGPQCQLGFQCCLITCSSSQEWIQGSLYNSRDHL